MRAPSARDHHVERARERRDFFSETRSTGNHERVIVCARHVRVWTRDRQLGDSDRATCPTDVNQVHRAAVLAHGVDLHSR
ncbi:MAG: hypothetical protein A3G76_10590 [Acidobacteria bacterium RIFCSPLOWO2_12_FULL_65_11]|nr:MAG: hypothetical protein A3H95_08295 [Acidobacteria bacterium RIFCSPLOWO2_02_FULL_64_15]OFW30498.1 MAG: hypothetical protein A3G76_10590 [Acidobacteria bacterium RIFCSPLOWO2_12_FULL_65_11]